MTITPLDAVQWVRSRPQQFFGDHDADALKLLCFLMADVIELGKGDCSIRRCGSWWIIGSDTDWFINLPCSIDETFQRVVPAPQHGEHSMRGEILVFAFAADISVVGPDGITWIVGAQLGDDVVRLTDGMKRAIVFRLPGAA